MKPLNVWSRSDEEIGRLLSNFAHTPFVLDSVAYASVEGFYAALLIDNNKAKQATARTYLWAKPFLWLGRYRYFLDTTLCGLRLPIRPLSVPAFSSITALTKVGLPESIAAFTARLNSSGDVTWTPTPPNASIILS